MGDAGISLLLSQLSSRAPTFLVYLVAFVLALAYFRRSPISSILTVAGVGTMSVTSIGLSVAQAWLIDARPEGFDMQLKVLGVAGGCLHAIGLGMLVAAIFVGRRPLEAA